MVQTVRIKEWKQLLDLEDEGLPRVFRGHSNSSWPLETSLRRTIRNNNKGYPGLRGDPDRFAFAERASLKTFRSRAHLYLDHLPDSDDHVGWLAVMQHHGAPTRLLDFSYSLYVACYFALIDSVGESCVWAIDDNWLRQRGTKYAGKLGVKATNDLRFGQLASIYEAANMVVRANNFDSYEYESPERVILMIEVEKQIPRLAVQQGVFLMPTDLNTSFSGNLDHTERGKLGKRSRYVKKLIFPHEIRSEGLTRLMNMNITAETLFPGVDGFARSLIQRDMQ